MPLPEGVAGWSWGAFLSNWVWGIFNGTWISLLTLIPFVGWIMAFVLGFKGREWAWRNKRWQSVEHFQRVQRLWSVWSLSIVGVVFVIGIVGAIAIPAYSEYQSRVSDAKTAAPQEQPQASQAVAADAAEKAARAVPAPVYVAPAASVVTPNSVSEAVAPTTAVVTSQVSASVDLVERAQKCNEASRCIEVMLEGAMPRRPEVLTAAAVRLTTLDSQPAGDRKESRALNTQALTLYGIKDYSGAAEIFKQAAQINPRDAEIQSNFGLALIRAGKSEEAVQALIASLQLDPRRSNAWAPLAEALDKLQHPGASSAALLLVYEFSGNRQKTMDFFRSRAVSEELTESMRTAYASALKTIEVGY